MIGATVTITVVGCSPAVGDWRERYRATEARMRRSHGTEQRMHRDEKRRWYGADDAEAVKQRIVSRLGWML